MDVNVDGLVAVVTGGSRGIGHAIAQELLTSGAEGVVITSRKPENLQQAIAEIGDSAGAPSRIHGVIARADDPDAAAACIAETVATFGRCDLLVNNAGTNPAAGNLVDVDLGAVAKTWDVNQKGPLIWSREAWRQWMSEHGGSIVNVASVGAFDPSPLIGAYNISKAAVVHLTRQLAFEMAPQVRVNAVAPGIVKTRLSKMLWEHDEAASAKLHPLGRLGMPADVAHAVVFLCSDRAAWITGAVLPVDGGVIGASGALG